MIKKYLIECELGYFVSESDNFKDAQIEAEDVSLREGYKVMVSEFEIDYGHMTSTVSKSLVIEGRKIVGTRLEYETKNVY
jgi:hypothetical protein